MAITPATTRRCTSFRCVNTVSENSCGARKLARGGTVALTNRVPNSERVRMNHPSAAESTCFAGYRFPPEVIVLAVRWYLRYGLFYREVEELLAERGIDVDHVTIYRWLPMADPLRSPPIWLRPCCASSMS